MTPAVRLEHVRACLGDRVVLADVSLQVGPREAVALMGANGVGKSTLLNVVLGLHPPEGGSVTVLGDTPPSSGVGFVPQDPGASLLPWLRVGANIVLPLRLQGLAAAACRAALDEVVQHVDPARCIDLNALPQDLSGGERQRVALMRGLVTGPRLLVCDEPFAAVDAPARAHLRDALAAITLRDDGPALLLVTHDVEDAVELASRAIILAGRPARVHAEVEIHAGNNPRLPIHKALLCG